MEESQYTSQESNPEISHEPKSEKDIKQASAVDTGSNYDEDQFSNQQQEPEATAAQEDNEELQFSEEKKKAEEEGTVEEDNDASVKNEEATPAQDVEQTL